MRSFMLGAMLALIGLGIGFQTGRSYEALGVKARMVDVFEKWSIKYHKGDDCGETLHVQ